MDVPAVPASAIYNIAFPKVDPSFAINNIAFIDFYVNWQSKSN